MKNYKKSKAYLLIALLITSANFTAFLISYFPSKDVCPHKGGVFLIITTLGVAYLLTQLNFYRMQKNTKNIEKIVLVNSTFAALIVMVGSVLWFSIFSCLN